MNELDKMKNKDEVEIEVEIEEYLAPSPRVNPSEEIKHIDMQIDTWLEAVKDSKPRKPDVHHDLLLIHQSELIWGVWNKVMKEMVPFLELIDFASGTMLEKIRRGIDV